MAEADPFTDFMRRIRAGDEQAATELVRQYEPFIRREVRINLESHLGQLFDSMDICQSVLLSFFVRTAAGQYDLEEPQQLLKLLVTMARNKLASAARYEHQQRRDQRRNAPTGATDSLADLADHHLAPDEQLAAGEMLDRLRAAMTAEERQLADLRGQSLAWEDIAQQLGGTAQARRMQLARAIDRVAKEFNLELADA
jgi:RNA polymerase sigma factor (sigma-70 family)